MVVEKQNSLKRKIICIGQSDEQGIFNGHLKVFAPARKRGGKNSFRQAKAVPAGATFAVQAESHEKGATTQATHKWQPNCGKLFQFLCCKLFYLRPEMKFVEVKTARNECLLMGLAHQQAIYFRKAHLKYLCFLHRIYPSGFLHLSQPVNLLQPQNDGLDICCHLFRRVVQILKQLLQILLEVVGQQCAPLPAELNQPFFPRMGHLVQSE